MDNALYLHQFIILAGAMFLALLSPGPDFAMILKQSVTYGRRASIFTSIGIAMGISVHIIYSVLGIGLIISKSIILFNLIKFLGAAYLIYIGYHTLKAKPIKFENNKHLINKQISDFKAFRLGFLCNALNPKATMFFLSMFSVVISVDTPLYIQSFYGIFCIFETAFWFIALSFILSQKSVRNFLNSFGKWFNRAIGTVLIALGLKVAFSK
ncbi:LysE family translocator [Halarcobacter ebronensis]|uniref:Lysine transporter LysE n=1 Tax=Halarcobacter ebronensis TaxID=1462615 RepID=A0A4Q1AI52_9BACT|nr:LysE family transporter [Halarcobacter ebronensis]QKF83070.1 transporter, LysE family [Halarcobacter ebronensis]RXK02415.1 lysine transporter LysE [Halarcobacter ebronensis]